MAGGFKPARLMLRRCFSQGCHAPVLKTPNNCYRTPDSRSDAIIMEIGGPTTGWAIMATTAQLATVIRAIIASALSDVGLPTPACISPAG